MYYRQTEQPTYTNPENSLFKRSTPMRGTRRRARGREAEINK